MKHIYNLQRQPVDRRDHKASIVEAIELPSKVDFRPYCPPIYNQYNLGSCTSNAWLFSFLMYLQSMGVDISNTELSRLEHYWQERDLEGTVNQDCGATLRSGGKVLKNHGVCLEEFWQYIISKFADTPTAEALADAANHKIPSYKKLTCGIAQFKQYFAEMNAAGTPRAITFGIDVYESFESDATEKTGFVSLPNTSKEDYFGGHAIDGVGYDDDLRKSDLKRCFFTDLINMFVSDDEDEGYVICPNSWGPEWGDNGYLYLPYAFIRKGLAFDSWIIE